MVGKGVERTKMRIGKDREAGFEKRRGREGKGEKKGLEGKEGRGRVNEGQRKRKKSLEKSAMFQGKHSLRGWNSDLISKTVTWKLNLIVSDSGSDLQIQICHHECLLKGHHPSRV